MDIWMEVFLRKPRSVKQLLCTGLHSSLLLHYTAKIVYSETKSRWSDATIMPCGHCSWPVGVNVMIWVGLGLSALVSAVVCCRNRSCLCLMAQTYTEMTKPGSIRLNLCQSATFRGTWVSGFTHTKWTTRCPDFSGSHDLWNVQEEEL